MKGKTTKKEANLFVPCCIDQLYPNVGFDTIKVLEHLGVRVYYNSEHTCCGQTAFNNGFIEEAKLLGEKFIEEMKNGRHVVIPSASCAAYTKTNYMEMFFNSGYHLECKALMDRIFEFSDYLVNVLRALDIGAKFPHRVCFHDNCKGLRAYGIKEEPRLLLQNVEGLELLEMENTSECCGHGGTFALNFEPISVSMTIKKVQYALDTGAEYICSTDASCLGNMESYIEKQKLPIKCIHLASILASGL